MSLSDKSDREINEMVAAIEWPDAEVFSGSNSRSVILKARSVDGDFDSGCEMDWCNDDALAFRLMVDNDIVLSESIAHHKRDFIVKRHRNKVSISPNRAIAECFILMSQEAKS